MSETVLQSTVATAQHGVARADGELSVTAQHLSFTPFNRQLGLGPYQIPRDEIVAVERCTAKGAGILPLTNDAIRLTLNNGQAYQFIVAHPEQWATLLCA